MSFLRWMALFAVAFVSCSVVVRYLAEVDAPITELEAAAGVVAIGTVVLEVVVAIQAAMAEKPIRR
jgi:hypothetical protein